MCLIDPLDSPAPVIAGYSKSGTLVGSLTLRSLSFLPNFESSVYTCWCKKLPARGEANTRNIMLMRIYCLFMSTSEIIYCHLVCVGPNSYPRRIHAWPIHTPSRVIISGRVDVIVLEGVFVQIFEVEHPQLASHVNCNYKFLIIARYQLQIIYFLLSS